MVNTKYWTTEKLHKKKLNDNGSMIDAKSEWKEPSKVMRLHIFHKKADKQILFQTKNFS